MKYFQNNIDKVSIIPLFLKQEFGSFWNIIKLTSQEYHFDHFLFLDRIVFDVGLINVSTSAYLFN